MGQRSLENRLRTISVQDLREFLLRRDATYISSWGKFLDRYSLVVEGHSHDIVVPSTSDIGDYERRLFDLVESLSNIFDYSHAQVISEIKSPNYNVFKIRARPNSEVHSIPFDVGLGLLENSKALIQSSVLSEFSSTFRPTIRGKMPNEVTNYMDRVKLGQTEVGSYIFTLLLPPDSANYLADGDEKIDIPDRGSAVVDRLIGGLDLAREISINKRVPSRIRLERAGLPSDFYESLYDIVDWTDNVSLEIGHDRNWSQKSVYKTEFNREALRTLERVAEKLSPQKHSSTAILRGTVTKLSEPSRRRRGSLDLKTRYEGKDRSIRILFEEQHRDTVIRAFKDKSELWLEVKGSLHTEATGRLRLDVIEKMRTVNRGSMI